MRKMYKEIKKETTAMKKKVQRHSMYLKSWYHKSIVGGARADLY